MENDKDIEIKKVDVKKDTRNFFIKKINWFEEHSGTGQWAAAIVTLITLIFTISLQIIYMNEQDKIDLIKSRAYISMAINTSNGYFVYEVTNTGLTPAYNLNVETTILYKDGSYKKPIDGGSENVVLNPGQRFRGGLIDLSNQNIKGFSSIIKYEDYMGNSRYTKNEYEKNSINLFSIKNQEAD